MVKNIHSGFADASDCLMIFILLQMISLVMLFQKQNVIFVP